MNQISARYIFDIFSGSTPESGQAFYWGGDHNWFTPDDLGKNDGKIFVDESKRKITDEGVENANLRFAKPNSIIITKRAPIGNLAINTSPSSCNQGCFILEQKSSEINVKYYYYFFSIQRDKLNSLGRGSTFLELNADEMKGYKLPVPLLTQQNKIVDYLDKKLATIDSLIKNKAKQIDVLEEKKKAIINQAATKGLKANTSMKDSGIEWLGEIPEHWEINKVSRVFNTIGSGTTPSSSVIEYYQDGENNWLITSDLNDSEIFETSKKITEKALEDYSTLKLYPANSLVVAMYGATIGKTGLTKIDCYTNQACCVLSQSSKVLMRFAHLFFIAIKDSIVMLANGGGQPNISQGIIRDIKIIYPTIDEQELIINHVDSQFKKINNLIDKLDVSIEMLKQKRIAIISAAINGELNSSLS